MSGALPSADFSMATLSGLLGLAGAYAYGWLVMHGLRTWWVGAVGTTALRLLESAADAAGTLRPFDGATDIFITPGFRFREVGRAAGVGLFAIPLARRGDRVWAIEESRAAAGDGTLTIHSPPGGPTRTTTGCRSELTLRA